MEQLRRMREMQYAYHRKFFQGLYFFLVLVLACLAWDKPVTLAMVPFLVVTAGTQSCFYLHFADFARIHARHLESRLNRALGEAVHQGSRLEEVYFYPLDTPKIGGFLPSHPLRFFSFFTAHWVLLWIGLAVFALARLLTGGWPGARDYAIGWILWAGLHGLYLAWYFLRSRDLRAVQSQLDSVSRSLR